MCARVRFCVYACAVLIRIASGAPDNPSTWGRSQPQQTLHGLMVSIDERLHILENARWDSTLKQVEQRLDSLETIIRRLDSTFQDRLDKVERNLNSKELKEELTVEKLSHKVRDILDSSYDRYNRRLGYTEERLELTFKKVQMSVEGSLNRIEKQQEDIQTEVLEVVSIVEDLKSHSFTTEDKFNSTQKALRQDIQSLMSPNHKELQRISGSLEHLESRLNNSVNIWGSQNDGPPVGDVITTMRNEINTEVSNMYNDVWRRLLSIESLIKDLNKVSNTTQQEMLDEVRSLVQTDHQDFPGSSQENFIEVALAALERKLQRKLLELGRKIDDRLDNLSATQNLVMDSCFDGGICRGLELRLSQVLEKIFDVFSDKIEGFSNRTFDMDDLVMEMLELVKTQHSQLIRTITHNTNMVITLAKDSSDANKLLHNTITQFAEKTEYNFQEVHDEVQEIYNTSGNGKVCNDSDKNTEESTQLQKPLENSKNNITQIEVVTFNMTHPSKNNTFKHHSTGVIKITTDDLGVMSDNGTLKRTNITQSELKLNTSQVVDTSIIQVIGMISPNLTPNQLETLLQVLNKSISLENLEAIIQNTEAKSEEEAMIDGGTIEIYDTESLNNTNVDGDFNLGDKDSKKLTLPEKNYGEIDNSSDESNDDLDQNRIIEVINTKNKRQSIEEKSGMDANKTEPTFLEVSTNLKDQIKVYALIMKIKYGNLNITELWKQNKNNSHMSENQASQIFLPILQKLCYGEENIRGFTPQYINDIMRDRLLLINQTINDIDLYEKIENICNTMIESLQHKNVSEEVLPDDQFFLHEETVNCTMKNT